MSLNLIRATSLILFLFGPGFSKAQPGSPKSEILPASQVAAIFTDSIKKEFKISYPIFRVIHYTDKSGQYYCVLTESMDTVVKGEEGLDTLSRALKAVDLKIDQDKLAKAWEINDFIIKKQDEITIRFWTRFSEF